MPMLEHDIVEEINFDNFVLQEEDDGVDHPDPVFFMRHWPHESHESHEGWDITNDWRDFLSLSL